MKNKRNENKNLSFYQIIILYMVFLLSFCLLYEKKKLIQIFISEMNEEFILNYPLKENFDKNMIGI